ncbi:MAG: polysaccharide biosynthesis C-terminal domain-containing protein [Chthoniobacterales bacterium]|nr:polysaccharide biosynthesis C-terminal domain-containing protein [Chthoniobacterales bacterium]
MSISARIIFGASATWLSRGVSIVLGLTILPVLFRHLPKEELGLWLLLGQSWAAMGILDFGLTITLTRRIALAKGKSGTNPDAPLSSETVGEIADLVASGRRIYYFLAAGVFLLSWAAGFLYLRDLHPLGVSYQTVWIAWTILCASQSLNLLAAIWDCLLLGIGYVGWDALVASFASAVTLSVQIVVVLLGGRLIALACVATAGAVVARYLTRWLAYRRRPELFVRGGRWNRDLLQGVPGLAFRAWLTAAGTALVFSTDQFFIASSKGTESIPAFRAAYILVHNITVLAVTFGLASSVFISHLWQAGDLNGVRRLVERNTRLGLLIMLCGFAFLMSIGRQLFDLWLGQGNFVGFGVLLIFLIYETLEAQSYIISTSSRATNDEAFALSSIAAGLLKVALALILMRYFGLVGLALGTLVALLVTNHWYTVFRGLRRLQIPFFQYVYDVVGPSLAWAALALAASYGTALLLSERSPLQRVIAVASATGVIFVAACACLVLTKQERVVIRVRIAALVSCISPGR